MTQQIARETCCLCGGGPLVSSHVIPKAAFKLAQDDGKYIKIEPSSEGPVSDLAQSTYAEPLMCARCDSSFGELESQGLKWLKSWMAFNESEMPRPHILPDSIALDTEKLKRLLILLSWRSSIASTELYRKVSLGAKMELRLKDALRRKGGFKRIHCAMSLEVETCGMRGGVIFDPESVECPVLNGGKVWTVRFPGFSGCLVGTLSEEQPQKMVSNGQLFDWLHNYRMNQRGLVPLKVVDSRHNPRLKFLGAAEPTPRLQRYWSKHTDGLLLSVKRSSR